MKTIWKFELEITRNQVVAMPLGERVLSVGEQDGRLFVWALVDTDAEMMSVPFFVAGTGHQVNESSQWEFIDTVQMSNGLVWHVFMG